MPSSSRATTTRRAISSSDSAMTTPSSDDPLLQLRRELAELRELVEGLHAEAQLARAEVDEVLSIVRALAADLAERR